MICVAWVSGEECRLVQSPSAAVQRHRHVSTAGRTDIRFSSLPQITLNNWTRHKQHKQLLWEAFRALINILQERKFLACNEERTNLDSLSTSWNPEGQKLFSKSFSVVRLKDIALWVIDLSRTHPGQFGNTATENTQHALFSEVQNEWIYLFLSYLSIHLSNKTLSSQNVKFVLTILALFSHK